MTVLTDCSGAYVIEDVEVKSKFPAAVPEIPVQDIAAASAYYEQRLGFTIDWGGPELGLVGVSRDNCRLFLANEQYRSHYRNAVPALIWLNLETAEEVDQLYQAWSATNVRMISAPESKSWGLHEFTAQDLDGNFLRVFYDFATPQKVSTERH